MTIGRTVSDHRERAGRTGEKWDSGNSTDCPAGARKRPRTRFSGDSPHPRVFDNPPTAGSFSHNFASEGAICDGEYGKAVQTTEQIVALEQKNPPGTGCLGTNLVAYLTQATGSLEN